jgi:exodeoxyribonuclease VII small subunit
MTTKKKADSPVLKGEEPTFEKALVRLETIVKEMESGELSLEVMMARFEEGQALVKMCSEKLNQVERKIEVLVKEGDQITAQPFESDAEPEEEDGAAGDEEDARPF